MGLREELMLATRRPAGVATVIFLALAVIGLVAGAGALLGTWIGERASWPPLEVRLEEFETNGQTVTFRLIGRKLTDRSIVGQTVAWVYSAGFIEPQATYRPDGQVTAPIAIVRQGETFQTALLRVEVPAAVFSDQGARFRICWAFEGQPTWCGIDVLFVDIPRTRIGGEAQPLEPQEGDGFRSPSIPPIR